MLNSDLYECQLSPTDSEPIVVSNVARLAVIGRWTILGSILNTGYLAEPLNPVAFVGNQIGVISATEGAEIHLSCRSEKGRPAAKLQWTITADRGATRLLSHISNETKSSSDHHALRG